MASIKQLYTRSDNNKVERIKIGSGEWIEYLGTDSDAFREAKREMQKKIISGELDAADSEAFLLSSLITDWSFDEECNDENKRELLRESPGLAESLDRAASQRANFIKRLSQNSTNTQKRGSGSRSRKTPKSKDQ